VLSSLPRASRTKCTHAMNYLLNIHSKYSFFFSGKVRLVEGIRSNEGRVQVYHDSDWFFICYKEWNLKLASIVCRSLGLPEPIHAFAQDYLGVGSRKVNYKIFDYIKCVGNETSLMDCQFKRGYYWRHCFNTAYASVVCGKSVGMCSTNFFPKHHNK